MEHERPKVGVGVLILKGGQVLLGKRKGSHGAGEYSFPGGYMEYMESFKGAVVRETKEECGIEITNIKFQLLANVKDFAPKHFVQIGLIADWKNGEPRVMEPEKFESWGWFDLSHLPEPLFVCSRIAIEALRTGKMYSDIDDEGKI